MSEYRPGHLFLSRKFWPGIYSSPASIKLHGNFVWYLPLFPIQNQSFTVVSAHAQADGCQSRGHHVYKAVWTPSYDFHLDMALTHLCSFATVKCKIDSRQVTNHLSMQMCRSRGVSITANSCLGPSHYSRPVSTQDPASIKDLSSWPSVSIRAHLQYEHIR